MADVNPQMIDWYSPLVNNQPLFNPSVAANIGQTQANTALLGAQAKGAAIQNQQAALSLGLYQKMLGQVPGALNDQQQAANDKSGVANPDAGDGTPPTTGQDDPLAHDKLAAQNFVNPAGTPQQQQALQQAAALKTIMPGMYEQAQVRIAQQIQSQTAQNQVSANNGYEALSHVADAPDGAAMASLATIAPTAAKWVQAQQPPDATPTQLDAAARAYAESHAADLHQYTGRKAVIDDSGVSRDEVTGLPIPGVPSRGLSTQQWADLSTKLNAPVENYPLPNGQKGTVPTYVAMGYPAGPQGLQQALAAQGAKLGVGGLQPNAPGVVQAQTKAAIQNAEGNAHATTPALGNPKSSDPITNTALQDKDYRAKLPTSPAGVSLSPDQQTIRDNYSKNYQQVGQDAAQAVTASTRALAFYKMADDVLQHGNAATGPLQNRWSTLQSWAPGVLGQGPMPTDTQELAKLLGNAALQVGKGNFSDGLTNDKTELQLGQLSPNVKMTGPAIQAMIRQNMAIQSYDLASATRVNQYLMAGNDPQQFKEWNQKYWPAEKVIPAAADALAKHPAMQPKGATATPSANRFAPQNETAAAEQSAPAGGQPAAAATPAAGRVRVIGPNGQSGTLPAAQLQMALSAGYRAAP